MTKKNIKKEFIDAQIAAFSQNSRQNELLIRHQKIISLICKYVPVDATILDIGCYDGVILKALEKKGYQHLYGIDFSETSKKSFAKTSIHFAQCDVEQEAIPFNKKFDLVIFTDVLEHFFSPQSVLFELKKKLAPDAKIIFSVPNAGWFLNGFLLSFLPSKLFLSTAFGPWGHTYQFTFYQASKMAGNLKFKLIELTGTKMDNYAFKTGFKKAAYDVFSTMQYLPALAYPQIFSAHIFGVFQNTSAQLTKKAHFELGE